MTLPPSLRIREGETHQLGECPPGGPFRSEMLSQKESRNTMRADIVPGATFPDYELTDHTQTRRRLSELQGDDPMILILSRGHYCPKDNQQHLELAAFYPQIAVAYTRIVTISTGNLLETREFRDSVGAQWTFLSDSGRKIQQDLDIQEYTDPFPVGLRGKGGTREAMGKR